MFVASDSRAAAPSGDSGSGTNEPEKKVSERSWAGLRESLHASSLETRRTLTAR
jgi:hypothetical protein